MPPSLALAITRGLLCLLLMLVGTAMSSPLDLDYAASPIEKRWIHDLGPAANMGDRIMIGGLSGSFFTDWPFVDYNNGAIARRLEIWSSDDNVQGFRIYYTDGSKRYRGKLSGSTSGTLDLAPGELISSLEIWQTSDDINDGNDRNADKVKVARVRIETSTGKTLDVGCKDSSGYASYDVDVYSGVLVGADSRVHDDLRSFGLIFLKSPIQSLEITDMKYPATIVGSSQDITDRKLDELRQVRQEDDPDTYNWSFSGATEITESHEVSSSTANAFGLTESLEIGGGFLGLGGVKSTTGFSWEITQTNGESATNSLSYTETWSQSGTLQPGEGVHVTASIMVGKITVPYTATMVMTLEDGTVINYVDKGKWNNVGYSSVFVSREIYKATSADTPSLPG